MKNDKQNKQPTIVKITITVSFAEHLKSMRNKFSPLHPAWIVGFIDGEGTFSVDILSNQTIALKYQVQLRFIISQHVRDAVLMYRIKDYFGCGTIVKDTDTKLQYRIRSISDLETKLFPLLKEYPLQTQKSLDAAVFIEVYDIIKKKDHLTQEGLDKIRVMKASMNRGRIAQYKINS